MTSARSGGGRRGALVCLLAGALLALAMPHWGWWPLAFVAFALFSHQVDDPSRRRRAGRGALFALGWFVPAIFWMLDFTLPGYGIAVALWCGFWALAALLCPPGRWRWVGLVGAAVLAEYVRWSWPFGGQPLATVAMTQVDSPLGPTVRVLGPLLLVALVVTVGVALASQASRPKRRPSPAHTPPRTRSSRGRTRPSRRKPSWMSVIRSPCSGSLERDASSVLPRLHVAHPEAPRRTPEITMRTRRRSRDGLWRQPLMLNAVSKLSGMLESCLSSTCTSRFSPIGSMTS